VGWAAASSILDARAGRSVARWSPSGRIVIYLRSQLRSSGTRPR
jgi:hypothetical protein